MDTHKRLRHALCAVSFLAIAAAMFVFFTYLFRETRANQRRNILSYYLEEDDTIDVVYVGASSVYRFFSPLQAYEEAGFASFDYAAASMKEISYITAIRDVLKTQKPKLLLIDARRFLKSKVEKPNNDTIRFFLDSLDMGWNRFDGVLRYAREYGLTVTDTVPLLLDLCLYHNNTEALTSRLHWSLADNRVSADTEGLYAKGFGMSSVIRSFDAPEITTWEDSVPLLPRQERQLRELCAYLAYLDTDVLLVVSAYLVTDAGELQYNKMAEIAAEYGLPFLDTNRYAEEIGYDYRTDFYNERHTNLLGAEKFTSWMTAYLKEHYDLPDHRGEAVYEDWEAALFEYRAETAEAHLAMDDAARAIAAS